MVLTALAEEATAFEEVTGSHDWRETTHRRYLGALIGGNRNLGGAHHPPGNVPSAGATTPAVAPLTHPTTSTPGNARGVVAK